MEKVKNKGKNNIALWLQAVIGAFLVLIAIMYLWIPELIVLMQGLAVAFLWIGSYNSYKLYNKKFVVVLYVLAGSIILYDLVVGMF